MERRWIIKNIFKIHPFYLICLIICSFTGHLKDYIMISIIILFHEFGHILVSIIYKWKIEKVVILPFGAITIFNEKINRPLKEEWFILMFGPIFQLVLSFFLNDKYTYYSNVILLFNLLPVYPLDGSKILNILLNKFISFKKSHLLTIYISVITIVFIIYKSSFNLILVLILLFISRRVLKEYKNHSLIFNKFLLERYNNNFIFKKIKYINSLDLNKMKKDYRHFFKSKNGYITEREILKKRFDFNSKK